MTAPQATNAFSRYASVLRPGLFAGETHWVTGGGSGIGRCVAHELASLGATVVLTGRAAEKLKKVAAEIAEDGGRADIAAFDIRDEEAVRGAVKDVVARHGRIHGLVNNADTGDLAHSKTLLGHRNREMTEHYVRQRVGERVQPLR